MKPKMCIAVIAIALIFSCSETAKTTHVNEEQANNETPRALSDKSDSGLEYLSSKRYYNDIISKLYNEAIEKNAELKTLNDRIIKISEIKNDSISLYQKYSETNDDYWQTASRYINQINDSILKQSTLKMIESLESKYETNVSEHEQKIADITKKTIVLDDQLVLMKLFVTQSMIKNYQLNELPDIESLKSVLEEYKKGIKEIEAYVRK